MKRLNYYILKSIILLTLLTLSYSCVTSSGHNRGSLSDAMDRADDDYKGDRSVPDNNDNDSYWMQDDDNNTEYDDLDIYVAPGEPIDGIFIVRNINTISSSPYFDKASSIELLYGADGDIFSGYLFGGIDILNVNKNHDVYDKIENYPIQLYIGFEARYYPFKELKYLSPYILGRIGGMVLFWDFKNTIYSGGDSINYDSLSGAILDAGIGIDILHTERFRLGAIFMPQSNLYGLETNQGFNNDYFDVNGDISLAIEIGYKF